MELPSTLRKDELDLSKMACPRHASTNTADWNLPAGFAHIRLCITPVSSLFRTKNNNVKVEEMVTFQHICFYPPL